MVSHIGPGKRDPKTPRRNPLSPLLLLRTKQIKLHPDRDEAFRLYHERMSKPPEEQTKTNPVPSGQVVEVLDAFLEWARKNKARVPGKPLRINGVGGNAHEAEGLAADVWIHNYNITHVYKNVGELRPVFDDPLKLSLCDSGIAYVKDPKLRDNTGADPRIWRGLFGRKLTPSFLKQTKTPQDSHAATLIGTRLRNADILPLSHLRLPLSRITRQPA